MDKKYNYVIGSGWWCAENNSNDTREKLLGSDQIRGKDFHALWYQSVNENCSPRKIIIVDSASPIKPDLSTEDPRIEFISLSTNAGHSTNHTGKYCGWTRSVMLGMQYAIANDAEYYVYVEQDALLSGKGIIEYCVDKMTAPYMFGSGEGTPQLLQQSFFIIARSGMERFLSRLMAITARDGDMCPEDKFHISASSWPIRLASHIMRNKPTKHKKRKLSRKIYSSFINRMKNYDRLPIGYGRTRPLNTSDTYFYFQHGTDAELCEYLEKFKP